MEMQFILCFLMYLSRFSLTCQWFLAADLPAKETDSVGLVGHNAPAGSRVTLVELLDQIQASDQLGDNMMSTVLWQSSTLSALPN